MGPFAPPLSPLLLGWCDSLVVGMVFAAGPLDLAATGARVEGQWCDLMALGNHGAGPSEPAAREVPVGRT